MKTIRLEQPSKRMELYIVGDTHYPRGKRNKFVKLLKEIEKNDEAYVLGLGDWCECIGPSDPRYNPEEIQSMVDEHDSLVNMMDQQWAMFEEDIKPIAHKILGLHAGNHESKFARKGHNELKNICRRNKITYLDEGHVIHEIKYKNDRILIQSFHGTGAGSTIGSTYNKLDAYSLIADDVDIIAAGHTHKLGVNITADRLKVTPTGLKSKVQYHCSCGSFLGNYDEESVSYAERKAYRPLPIGYIKIIIDRGEIIEVRAIPV